MKYRKLDSDGDYSFGHGSTDWWTDVPDAPAQAVHTRLGLWQGEWFLDSREGMPWTTEVLGKYTESTRDVAIKDHILQTEGVTSIEDYYSDLNRDTRFFSGGVTVNTVYGSVSIVEPK